MTTTEFPHGRPGTLAAHRYRHSTTAANLAELAACALCCNDPDLKRALAGQGA